MSSRCRGCSGIGEEREEVGEEIYRLSYRMWVYVGRYRIHLAVERDLEVEITVRREGLHFPISRVQ
jgi:hypothetical protein